MESFFKTLALSFVFIVAALALLGIGWLITGRQKIKGGTCGRDPTRKQDKKCGGPDLSCPTCGKKEPANDEEIDDDN